MKILITGAKGMLGQYMANVMPEHVVYGRDRKQLDICDKAKVKEVFKENSPDVVINCAAYNDVDGAETNTREAINVNATGARNLAKACKLIGATLVHFSTSYVFSGEEKAGYVETAEPNPVNIYGRTKLAGERAIKDNLDKHYIIRTSRLFGRQGNSENSKKPFTGLMIEKAKSPGSLRVVDDEIDLPTYALDLAVTTRRLIDHGMEYGMYHVTNPSKPCSWYEFTKELFRLLSIDKEIIPVKGKEFNRRAKRPLYANLASHKIFPIRTWQVALKAYLNEGEVVYDISGTQTKDTGTLRGCRAA